ncbi:Fanconi anemia group E protein isoform X2 [Mastacembelus armatus]|uniref:Fanconi anemia group E protein isoform X2 n=1 Tax=Mastacembelus armatus TaxID=205130 RepID=UPI000E45F80C|nr:Fanconi anemia group E protein isoform X2 [Mastacembelus armatus]
MFLNRFDSQSMLLVRSLMSGASGAHRALNVFHRQRRANPDVSLSSFIETLCRDEVLCPQAGDRPLTVKPLVCLFPPLFKQNLLSFIYLVHSVLPRISVLQLLSCLSQDPHPNAWVTTLCKQLERSLGTHTKEPLYTPHCSQRLKELSQRLVGFGEAGGWMYLGGQIAKSASAYDLSEKLGTQRKRKGSFVSVESDGEEIGQRSKRIKMDVCVSKSVDAEEWSVHKETSGRLNSNAPGENPAEDLQPAPDSPCDTLPEHIKLSVLQIKELLESPTEWDQSPVDVFKVLNDCDPTQVEVLCSTLSFPDLPEQILTKLCSSVLALSPELSYSTAATLIKSLLLEKVLSLSEPASRCLVTTATSLCNHYPRPMCHALIGPVLQEKNIGSPQAELLSRLIEDCLDSHYRLLVLQMTINIVWSEALLSIIHSLLDSKPDLNEELFAQFTEQLVSQGPHFIKSVKFAKMMLTVLTKYSSDFCTQTVLVRLPDFK